MNYDKDILEKSFCEYVSNLNKLRINHIKHGESVSLNTFEIREILKKIERVCYLLDQFFLERHEGEYELCCKRNDECD